MKVYTMPSRLWKMPNQSQVHQTHVEIDGSEYQVAVVYSDQPAEPDVGIAAGIEIEGVYCEDQGDIQKELTEDQLDELALEIGQSRQSAWEYAQERTLDD